MERLVGRFYSLRGKVNMQDEKEITKQIIKYRNTLLRKVEGVMLSKFIEQPIEELTEFQDGYEAGLNDAIEAVRQFLIL